ncbi:MAG: DUF3144 domain-containing protein [Acidobacteriota bacterium]|nr:DUF3144 domain-containing protein [Acidobacteriota bacterium]
MAEIDMESEFYDVADEFINLANKLREKHSTTRISAVMMFATSRYNAFNFFMTDGAQENEEKAIDYYCEQYRLMLIDNFDRLRDEFNNK